MDLQNQWRTGNAVLVGGALWGKLLPQERVFRVGAVLDVCRRRWGSVPEIEALAAAVKDPAFEEHVWRAISGPG